jgi:4-amino-4-deoxy-L-arabinose transferase-like glycosyltransferase
LSPCLLVYLLFFHALGERDLWSSHEARAAQDAQRMLDDGDWLQPRLFDDHFDYQKPPLFYWLVAYVGRLRGGVDAWSVRLPSALAALGTVLLVYGWLARRGRPVAGVVAALILATMQHFTWLARTGRIDMPLTFAVAAAVLGRGRGVRTVAAAAAVLLKGPVGLVIPAVTLLATGRGRKSGFGPLLIGALLALPWFVAANTTSDGEFFRVFFWYHNVQRALGGAEALAAHPWWFYAPRLAVDLLPWSPVLIAAAVGTLRGRRADREALLGLAWLLAVALLLSCSRFKRADYLLPAYPGAALLIGCACERWFGAASGRVRALLVVGLGAAVVGAAAVWAVQLLVVLPRSEPAREQRTFARAIRELAPAPRVVLFFRAEDHALAFHLGRPVNTFLEWENLDVWAGRPGTHYLVMPPECARQWQGHVTSGELEEVLSNVELAGGRHERPLVLMRTRPRPP